MALSMIDEYSGPESKMCPPLVTLELQGVSWTFHQPGAAP